MLAISRNSNGAFINAVKCVLRIHWLRWKSHMLRTTCLSSLVPLEVLTSSSILFDRISWGLLLTLSLCERVEMKTTSILFDEAIEQVFSCMDMSGIKLHVFRCEIPSIGRCPQERCISILRLVALGCSKT